MTKKKHQNAVSKLSEREKQIIHLLYIEEREVDEVAKLLNISTKTILNTKKKALNKLKNDMEGDL
jgi:RNA polymerase sigma factor (sigma-70 family)